ncbi:MAG: hypothetical protein ABGF52_08090 [Candidatus Asgardarchaeum sp.]
MEIKSQSSINPANLFNISVLVTIPIFPSLSITIRQPTFKLTIFLITLNISSFSFTRIPQKAPRLYLGMNAVWEGGAGWWELLC